MFLSICALDFFSSKFGISYGLPCRVQLFQGVNGIESPNHSRNVFEVSPRKVLFPMKDIRRSRERVWHFLVRSVDGTIVSLYGVVQVGVILFPTLGSYVDGLFLALSCRFRARFASFQGSLYAFGVSQVFYGGGLPIGWSARFFFHDFRSTFQL